MSVDTFETARDAILSAIYTRWNDGEAATLLGYQPDLLNFMQEKKAAQDNGKHYATVSMQSVSEHQSTLSTCVDQPGKRRYEITGLVFVQIFSPKINTGQYHGGKLAIIARSAFRGKTAGATIVFRNARINELPSEVDCYRFNVVTEFEYDDIN